MDKADFWLILIGESDIVVSLISCKQNIYSVTSIGESKTWEPHLSESLVSAVDESLGNAATTAGISEDQEPSQVAFILPPYWVDSDGKIIQEKLKLIEVICKSLSLKPLGFISNDEAITESINYEENFPASFVLLNITPKDFVISLVYMGKIKSRLRCSLTQEFSPNLVENALQKIRSDSTLPPKIIVIGNYADSTIIGLKDYPWVGKQNIETFLHYPEVIPIPLSNVIKIYTRVIASQINPAASLILPEKPQTETSQITEVSPESLGFTQSLPPPPEPLLPPQKPKVKISFKLPKLKLPKINIKWPIVVTATVLIFLATCLFVASTDIVIFVSPYHFSKKIDVTIDTTATEINQTAAIIPAKKQSYTINASATVKTTGQKTVGEKSKGEITVYNILNKTQHIPKGSILTDSTGKKFELTNNITIASGSANLDQDQGVINLGQTKTIVSALDIGSEYDLPKNTKLYFKDYSETSIIAKISQPLTGGSRREINVVTPLDKTNLEKTVSENLAKNIDEKTDKEINNSTAVIKGSIRTKKQQIDFSREVGEEADELTGTITATINVFILNDSIKNELINQFLSPEPDYSRAVLDPKNFKVEFTSGKIEETKMTSTLNLEGDALPKIDKQSLQKKLSGQLKSRLKSIIVKEVPRVYNYNFENHPSFIPSLFLLPFRWQNINIEVKTEKP